MGGPPSTPSPSCKAPDLLVTARPAPSWPCNQGASVAPALGTSAHCCGELTRPCDVDLGASGNTKGHVSLYTGHGPGGGGAVLCAARGFRDFTGMLCPFYRQGNRDLERVSLPGCPAVSGRNRSAGRTALGHCTASSPDSRRRACNLLCSPWALLCLRDPGDSLRPEQGGVQAPGWVSSGACIPSSCWSATWRGTRVSGMQSTRKPSYIYYRQCQIQARPCTPGGCVEKRPGLRPRGQRRGMGSKF